MELIGIFTDGRYLVAMTPEEWASQFGEQEVTPSPLLGVKLRFWRAAHHLSLRDIASKCGVSASTLSRIENGKDTGISVSTLMRVQALFAEPRQP